MENLVTPGSQNLNENLKNFEEKLNRLDQELNRIKNEDSVSIVCFSGEWDRLFAAFTIANGALALGKEVHLYFTFWGTSAVRNNSRHQTTHTNNKTFTQKMLGWILPKSATEAPLSKLNMGGLGKKIMGKMMRSKGVDDLPTLIQQARELGAHFHYCDTSLQLFGFCDDDLMDGPDSDWCGVSTFLSLAFKSRVTLFI